MPQSQYPPSKVGGQCFQVSEIADYNHAYGLMALRNGKKSTRFLCVESREQMNKET